MLGKKHWQIIQNAISNHYSNWSCFEELLLVCAAHSWYHMDLLGRFLVFFFLKKTQRWHHLLQFMLCLYLKLFMVKTKLHTLRDEQLKYTSENCKDTPGFYK